MEIVPQPNIVSDHIKAFLDDPQWLDYIKYVSNEAYQEAEFFAYIIMLEIFLVIYSFSSNRFAIFLVNYSCPLKCIKKCS